MTNPTRKPIVIPADAPDWVREELAKVSAMNFAMDAVLGALARPEPKPEVFHSFDTLCPKCGAKEQHLSRKPMERAEYTVVCDRCLEG